MSRAWVRTLVVILVVAMILLGAFRDFLFVNVNFQLQYLWKVQVLSDSLAVGRAHSLFDFLKSYDYYTVYYTKFALTLVFAFLYWLNTILVVKLVFGDKKFLKYTTYVFAIVVLISLVLYGGGYLFGVPYEGYNLANRFMKLIQSPLILMVLVPIFLLIKKSTQQNQASTD